MKVLDFEFPSDRIYDREHCWIKMEGECVRIGITDFFQKLANEIVFVELPATGRVLEAGKPFVSIESGKWVGRVVASFSGAVVGANDELRDFPYLLNDSAYDEGWLIDLNPSDTDFGDGFFDLNDPGQLKGFEDFLVAEQEKIAKMG